MTTEDYREMALALPEAVESSHMNHPDFRVRGKIFATILWPREGEGMVKLTPEEQKAFITEEPTMFEAGPGGWGAKGATLVHLARANKAKVRRALRCAWRNVAPKRLVAEFDRPK